MEYSIQLYATLHILRRQIIHPNTIHITRKQIPEKYYVIFCATTILATKMRSMPTPCKEKYVALDK